jgi:WD40 repeat protein
LISSASGGTVSVWDRNSKRELQRLTLDHGRWHTERAVLSRDGSYAISMEEYCTVGLWDIAVEHRIAEIADCTGGLPVGFSPDSSTAFFQTDWGFLSFWDTHTLVETCKLGLDRLSESSVEVFDTEYPTDSLERTDPAIPRDIEYPEEIIFDWTNWEDVFADIDDHPFQTFASAVAVAPDNLRAAVCVGAGIHLLNLEEKDVEPWHRVHERGIRCVAWSPDGNYIATGGNDTTIRIWRAREIA